MGSGKSTIGPILANTIGYEFVDIDRCLEEAVGMSVTRIFQEHGEPYFRQQERRLVAELSRRVRTVISLGGGTLGDAQNFSAITSSGIVVYLKVSPEKLFERLNHRDGRPLLTSTQGERLGPEALRERIQLLYNEREPVYAKADFTIVTDETRVGVTVDSIVKLLSSAFR